jgi:hypothetical protein
MDMYIKQNINFVILIMVLFSLCGCAGVIELPRRFLGISPYSFRKEHVGRYRYSQLFNSGYKYCYETILEVLKEMDVNVFYTNKKEQYILVAGFNRIFSYCIDTTKVCILFEEMSSHQTKVDVVCHNPRLAKFASERVFSDLKQKLSQKGGI